MGFIKTTEKDSNYNDLEHMRIDELLKNINNEDKTVPLAIEKALPQIEKLVKQVVNQFKKGGRLFYIGAGTSGRLGILDASECPPTFGVSHDLVIGLIAGGDTAIRKAVEFAEDSITQAWHDLKAYNVSQKDIVVGIEACNKHDIQTGCITCNMNSPLSKVSKYPIEVIVGPEFITGSSRMKAGTAQKLVLNMITTATMIQLGHIKDNKMVDMQLSNDKLVNRGTTMLMRELNISEEEAKNLLETYKSVRNAIQNYTNHDKK